MKHFVFLSLVCAMVGCGKEPAARTDTSGTATSKPSVEMGNRAGSAAPPTEELDAGTAMMADAEIAEPEPMMDAATTMDAAIEPEPMDAGHDAGTHIDAGQMADSGNDSGMSSDAGTGSDGGPPPVIDAGPPHTGPLRSISMHLTGMDSDLRHFTQFRLSDADNNFMTMFVIHEGIPTATYDWELRDALFQGEPYTLSFFIDHDEHTGPGYYDLPPLDHAWTMQIPAGNGDVSIDFTWNSNYFDIESIAPMDFNPLILSSTGMGQYEGQLFDVRVTDVSNGRLNGRQVREVPGDVFDLTVGSTIHPGLQYEVNVAVDADGNGHYNHDHDPSWRLMGTAASDGLHLTLNQSDAQTDVGF